MWSVSTTGVAIFWVHWEAARHRGGGAVDDGKLGGAAVHERADERDTEREPEKGLGERRTMVKKITLEEPCVRAWPCDVLSSDGLRVSGRRLGRLVGGERFPKTIDEQGDCWSMFFFGSTLSIYAIFRNRETVRDTLTLSS